MQFTDFVEEVLYAVSTTHLWRPGQRRNPKVLGQGRTGLAARVISEELQSMLVMVLPEICGEPMAYREAARHDPAPPAAGVDDDPIERIEGMTQHVCDELAETSARIGTLEERAAEILSHLKESVS